MQFYVVADEDTVVGFRYAGVPGRMVETPGEAADVIERLAAERAEMIVIVTERIAGAVRERINAIRFSEELPIIVEVPGPGGPVPDSPSLMKMIREAVGVKF